MVLLLLSCGDVNSEYSVSDTCHFSFITTFHTPSIIKDCCVNDNMFCFISTTMSNVRKVKAETYGKEPEEYTISSDMERRMSAYAMGANGSIIVGRSSYEPGRIYAFDRVCPNCRKNGVKRNVVWADNSIQVKCEACNRVYDLMSNGVTNGQPLLQYHASYYTTQSNYEVLQVVN